MNLQDQCIAMTDLETSGDIFSVHEILEIGLIVFHPKTFEIINTLSLKVKPEHIENALVEATTYNGYTAEKWRNAISLTDALTQYSEKTQNCVFASYNASFDWGFMNEAFYKTGLHNYMSTRKNHNRLDVLTLAYAHGLKNSPSLSLKSACLMFEIPPEPEPHSALNGAMTAYELWKKLMK